MQSDGQGPAGRAGAGRLVGVGHVEWRTFGRKHERYHSGQEMVDADIIAMMLFPALARALLGHPATGGALVT